MARRERASWYRELTPPLMLEDEDDEVVVLQPVDNSALVARNQLSLVGRMFHRGGRSIEALISLLPKANIWDVEGRVRGVSLGDSRFQFFFDTEADLQKILNKRPCHFNKWSFALERWEPHTGSLFPDSMTFWVKTKGIPSEYWAAEHLSNFGSSFGVVRSVDTTKGRIKVTVKADVPLKFSKSAQLPNGETVRVELLYEKLQLWCTHCRRICHVVKSCPLLHSRQRVRSPERRTIASSSRGHKRDRHQYQHPSLPHKRADSPIRTSRQSPRRLSFRYESTTQHITNGENSKRSSHPVSNSHHQHIEQGERDEDRSKRKNREYTSNRIKDTMHTSSNRDTQISDSQITITDPTLVPMKAKQDYQSPPLNRERPFRLNLQKRRECSSKGKGKDEGDSRSLAGESSETGSSAKKSLNFETHENALVKPNPLEPQPMVSLASLSREFQLEAGKSWYDITIEEEGDPTRASALADKFSKSIQLDTLKEIPDPRNHHEVGDNQAPLVPVKGVLDDVANDNNEDVMRGVEEEAAEWERSNPEAAAAAQAQGDAFWKQMEEDLMANDDLLGEDLKNDYPELSETEDSKLDKNQKRYQSPSSTPNDAEVGHDPKRALSTKKKAVKGESQRRKGIGGSPLLINAASKKILNIKGRSPNKRVSTKPGSSKPRVSTKPSIFPRSEVVSSTGSKKSVSNVVAVGIIQPSDSNT